MKRHAALRALVPLWLLCCAATANDAGDNAKPRGPREIVEEILSSKMSPADRMRALEPYVNVGRSREAMEKLLPPTRRVMGHGPGFMRVDYGELTLTKPGLSIHYYPDGEACQIDYLICVGGTISSIRLRSDDPITWPKTTDGENAKLRQNNFK